MDAREMMECTAHHEAAHAVAYHLGGIAVEGIWLHPFGEVRAGPYCRSRGRLVAMLAGPAADERLLSDRPDWLRVVEPLQKYDRQFAARLRTELGGDGDAGYLQAAEHEATMLVQQHWAVIQELACVLLARCPVDDDPWPGPTMDGREFSEWIALRLVATEPVA